MFKRFFDFLSSSNNNNQATIQ